MRFVIATILLVWLAPGWAQNDPFEPDDGFPLLGASLDGGQPDFTEPSGNIIGRVEGWIINERSLDGSQDLDWITFNRADYPYCEVEGELRIVPEGSFSRNNLRVEVLGYQLDSVLDANATPLTLQSCSQAPTGTTTIPLISDFLIDRDDFRTFYRLRSCNGQSGLRYQFQYRITNPGFCNVGGNIEGTVRDVRNGAAIPGAYVFSNLNDTTFASPSDGEFKLFVTNSSDVILNFLSGNYSSVGSVNIGPVDAFDFVDDVTLWGLPAGVIFFSGFE